MKTVRLAIGKNEIDITGEINKKICIRVEIAKYKIIINIPFVQISISLMKWSSAKQAKNMVKFYNEVIE